MICRYRYRVSGRVRLAGKFAVPTNGARFDFELNEHGVITHLIVEASVTDEAYWPQATINPAHGVSFGIDIPSPPALEIAQFVLRPLEGLLAIYGLQGINKEHPAVEWIPENDEEQSRLKLFSFQRRSIETDDAELRPLSFDLVARSVLAAFDARTIEVPLSFYRKGLIDCHEQRYIEAFYDFFFVLETVYGQGKFKKAALQQAFKSSAALVETVNRVVSDPEFMTVALRTRTLTDAYAQRFGKLSPEQILDELVEIRGLLHHHSSANRTERSWNPDDHQRFELEAVLIQQIAFGIVFRLAEPFVFDECHESTFLSLARTATGGR